MLCFRDETIQRKQLLPLTILAHDHAIVVRELLTYRDLLITLLYYFNVGPGTGLGDQLLIYSIDFKVPQFLPCEA